MGVCKCEGEGPACYCQGVFVCFAFSGQCYCFTYGQNNLFEMKSLNLAKA